MGKWQVEAPRRENAMEEKVNEISSEVPNLIYGTIPKFVYIHPHLKDIFGCHFSPLKPPA